VLLAPFRDGLAAFLLLLALPFGHDFAPPVDGEVLLVQPPDGLFLQALENHGFLSFPLLDLGLGPPFHGLSLHGAHGSPHFHLGLHGFPLFHRGHFFHEGGLSFHLPQRPPDLHPGLGFGLRHGFPLGLNLRLRCLAVGETLLGGLGVDLGLHLGLDFGPRSLALFSLR